MLARLSPQARSWLRLGLWTAAALVVAIGFITFAARSYIVHGISMEPTLHTGDIVFANKLGRTLADVQGKPFVPARGTLAVFDNPFYNQGDPNAFVIKRVIGLPGDRVVVSDGRITVYPGNGTSNFDPDKDIDGPQSPTSGNVDRTVPDGEIFVAGDNRLGSNSLDSRNGMSTVPLKDIQGVVILRIWPLQNVRLF